jgi:tripartite-type tricarboxylate transporter receptor subunit TctC
VVRLVVGFAAGGAADFVARQLAQNLQAELGATVVVDNRPGAGGRIAVDVARNAKPDGLTLLVTPGSILTIYPHVYDRLSYQPLRDLVPVANLCAVPIAEHWPGRASQR